MILAGRILMIAGAVVATACVLLAAAVLWPYEDVVRIPSPGGEFELLSREAEPNTFYVVRAGVEPRPEDEVLRADALAGCPAPPAAASVPAGPPGERKVVCSGAITLSWLSPSQVEFSVGDSVHIIRHVRELQGVQVSVRRLR